MISLIHPSRGRPEKAHATARHWFDNVGYGVTLEYILSCDSDDPKLNEYDPLRGAQNMRRIVNPNTCVVEATNIAAKQSNGDILIYLSDDFRCFPDWGIAVQNEFAKYSGPILIKVDDMLQDFNVGVLTIPMMTKSCHQALGYFYHPEYKSMFCDVHLYHRVKKLGFLRLAKHLKFEHMHPSAGKSKDDETYQRSSANWNHGLKLITKHQNMGYTV